MCLLYKLSMLQRNIFGAFFWLWAMHNGKKRKSYEMAILVKVSLCELHQRQGIFAMITRLVACSDHRKRRFLINLILKNFICSFFVRIFTSVNKWRRIASNLLKYSLLLKKNLFCIFWNNGLIYYSPSLQSLYHVLSYSLV